MTRWISTSVTVSREFRGLWPHRGGWLWFSHQTRRGPVPLEATAETLLLGTMLLSLDAVEVAQDVVGSSEGFLDRRNRLMAAAIFTLRDRGEPVDPVTVAHALRSRGLLDDAGGVERLLAIQMRTPATSSARHYAEMVAAQ